MPQILIREKDYTRPGFGEYSNFSVVVPGFVSADKFNSKGEWINSKGIVVDCPFDDNGICELSTQDEFVEKIGKVAPRALGETVADSNLITTTKSLLVNKITIQIKNHTQKIHTYTLQIQPDRETDEFKDFYPDTGIADIEVLNGVTPLVKSELNSDLGLYAFGTTDNPLRIAANDTVTLTINYDPKDDYHIKSAYKIVVIDNGAEDTSDKETSYSWWYSVVDFEDTASWAQAPYWPYSDELKDETQISIWLGTRSKTVVEKLEGMSTSAVPAHYGNQIAYELLGMGYPVLYVNMGPFNENNQGDVKRAIVELGKDSFWAGLRDKSTYDYRFIVTGLISGTTKWSFIEEEDKASYWGIDTGDNEAINAAIAISNLAAFEADQGNSEIGPESVSVRGDATALIDVDESYIDAYCHGNNTQSTIIAGIAEAVNSLNIKYGQYAAIFAPSVCYLGMNDSVYKNNKFPASFHYLACFSRSLQTGNPEWFAAAGLTRGVSNLTIDSTAYKLGEIAINSLEPRCKKNAQNSIGKSCNVIAKVRNNYYLWGNRTAYGLGDEGGDNGDLVASHFLNIRQLCSTLKKQIYTACRRFTFDPNSDVLWTKFCNAIRPTLERMKANQGIVDYKIIQVATTQKAKLKARVRIIPIEAVEDFDIEISLEDSFGDVSTTITE